MVPVDWKRMKRKGGYVKISGNMKIVTCRALVERGHQKEGPYSHFNKRMEKKDVYGYM